MKTQFLAMMVMAVALAGCSTTEETQAATGTMVLGVVDNAPEDIELDLTGAWVQAASPDGNGSWFRIASANETWHLHGSGALVNSSSDIPPGSYERIRLVLAGVQSGGKDAVMTESGVELPLNLTVLKDQETRLELTFSWSEALYMSAEGLTFAPTLYRVDLLVADQLILELVAKEIQTAATKAPVARIEAFDSVGLRFFESDFIAESPKERIVATGPNVTLTATGSEAVQNGASLSTFEWSFGDGTTAEGESVDHEYSLSGGNYTIRLTVTDSFGVQDSQAIKVAVKPGLVSDVKKFDGVLTGVYPISCASNANGAGAASHTVTVDSLAAPDGSPANLVQVKLNVYAVGNPHAGADLDIRLLNPKGQAIGSGTSAGTSEEVKRDYSAGSAPDSGDWVIEVKPCSTVNQDYAAVFKTTWLAQGPEPGYQAWLDAYDDGHDHSH